MDGSIDGWMAGWMDGWMDRFLPDFRATWKICCGMLLAANSPHRTGQEETRERHRVKFPAGTEENMEKRNFPEDFRNSTCCHDNELNHTS